MGRDGNTPICVAVIEAMAIADDTTPGDVEYSLHDHVHTDALALLGEDDRGTWEFTFQVPDHEVTIRDDGTIEVDGRAVDPRE